MPSIHPALRMSLIGLSAVSLTGCQGWSQRQTEGVETPQAASVLAELGVVHPARVHHHAAATDRPLGPSLVAGDSIAWNWAMAFNQAPAGERPNWAFAGITLD